ncbi:unnamed protein product [Didymodactylos carnosus]|uniref:VWFA domain-containing protein n=1 Tax=Didymodactylos carnosus TaxID=1234261 RepID=A0A8S2HY11_9BILA|nr:unnamed protein product [Didymodactylos carnosus]CAF3698274.1 unnamed protein product [Didymodactylos carnosus]
MGRHGLHAVHSDAWEKHHELPVHGIRSNHQMSRLITKLRTLQSPNERLQQLVYEMKISVQLFSGEQLLQLAPYFREIELILALHLFDHHLFGLKCEQAQRLLQMIVNYEQRLEALEVIQEYIIDPINRSRLQQLFPSYLLPQVNECLTNIRGQSHVYGSIRSQRVIFLIDTSGSMSTEFYTNCGEMFNRLEFIVHDMHKILHHRASLNMKFNLICFGTHVHKWKTHLTSANIHHLKQAEHFLDHLEAHGQTNTHDALRQAILDDREVDTIYLLSDGEPTTDMRTILLDLRQWLEQHPVTIHTVAFLMGHDRDDPKPRQFMADIASISGGVFRCLDPYTPSNQEFNSTRETYDENPNFQDDGFVRFFRQKLKDVPSNLLENIDLNQIDLLIDLPHPTPPDFSTQLKSRSRPATEISILSFHIDSHNHYTFDIHLHLQQIINCQWTVSRTYKEFKYLHQQLERRIGSINLPQLPHDSHLHLGKQCGQFMEERRKELDTYIKQLYVYVSPHDYPEFDLFLLMELHTNQIIQQKQIEWMTQHQNTLPLAPYESIPPPYETLY